MRSTASPPASEAQTLPSDEASPPISMKSKIGVNFLVSVGRTPDTGDNALAKLLQASQEMVSLFCPIHLVLSDFLLKLTWALRMILHFKSFVKICLFAMALVFAILSGICSPTQVSFKDHLTPAEAFP